MNNIFYVYIYLDPRKSGEYKYGDYTFDYEPFYVGKGKNRQFIMHIKESKRNFNTKNQMKLNKIRKIKRETGKYPIIVKIKENLLEQKSLDLEIKLIKIIGRLDLKTGPLTNLTNGGDGLSGYIFTEESKNKISKKIKGLYDGEKNPFFGKHHTEESKRKISEKKKGKKLSEDHIKKMSKANKGKNNPNYGKHMSEEQKRKISKSLKGIIRSEETKIKISKSLKGKIQSKETRRKRIESLKKYHGKKRREKEAKLNEQQNISISSST